MTATAFLLSAGIAGAEGSRYRVTNPQPFAQLRSYNSMEKETESRSLRRSVNAEVETLRLLAMQRRKASFRLFLKRSAQSRQGIEGETARTATVASTDSHRRVAQARWG
jgi:hypothetical protein